jgi:hypothetical protein
MNNIAFTWVWNDMVILELWCKYYSKYFEELLVLLCNTKPEYNDTLVEFKKKYNLSTERIQETEEVPDQYDRAREIVSAKQQELLKDHKWVLYSNCDEIVTTDPDKYKDLKDFMKRTRNNWEWCLGYEILQEPDEPHIDFSKPILRQRTSWLKNPAMNKVLLAKVPLSWNEGCHQIEETKGLPVQTMKNKGLIMLHLKHMDFDAPRRDWVTTVRPRFGFVMETFASRVPIPENLKDVI